jgi:hypothetical protein
VSFKRGENGLFKKDQRWEAEDWGFKNHIQRLRHNGSSCGTFD